MHKVELRCACHCTWGLGLVTLLIAGIGLAKFQVLLRYMDDSVSTLEVWGYSSAAVTTVPCIFGIFNGILPIFYAMSLSRARAERRDAMTGDVSIKRYKLDKHKELTEPRPVLKGEPPNPAMLNPIIESNYAANYPPGMGAGHVTNV